MRTDEVTHVIINSTGTNRVRLSHHISFASTQVIDKDGGFPYNKDEAKQAITHFCSAPRVALVLFDANQKEYGYCGK